MDNIKRDIHKLLIELRKLRKYHEISVKDLAREINMSKNTIQSMENLRTVPNIEHIIKIADYLGYSLVLER